MSIYQIIAIIIGAILITSFIVGGIYDRKTGARTWAHPGSTFLRLICACALLVDTIVANLT